MKKKILVKTVESDDFLRSQKICASDKILPNFSSIIILSIVYVKFWRSVYRLKEKMLEDSIRKLVYGGKNNESLFFTRATGGRSRTTTDSHNFFIHSRER